MALSDKKITYVSALVPCIDVKNFGFKRMQCQIRNDLTKIETGITVTANASYELKLIGKTLIFC